MVRRSPFYCPPLEGNEESRRTIMNRKKVKIHSSCGGKVPSYMELHSSFKPSSMPSSYAATTEGDLAMNQARFYEVPDKVVQDQALLHYDDHKTKTTVITSGKCIS